MFTTKAHVCDEYAKKYKMVKFTTTKKENVKKQQMICKITAQKNINPRGIYIIEAPSTQVMPRKSCTVHTNRQTDIHTSTSFKNGGPT